MGFCESLVFESNIHKSLKVLERRKNNSLVLESLSQAKVLEWMVFGNQAVI